MRKVVPWPGADLHVDEAARLRTMPNTVESPRPVPLPTSLVVKKGSKIFSFTSGDMPVPVSDTSIAT